MTNDPERWHPGMPKSTRFVLMPMIRDGFDIEVGDYSYGAPGIRWSPDQKRAFSLRIGKYCSFAADIDIHVGRQGRHTTDFLSTYPIGMVHGTMKHGDVSAAHEGNLSVTIGSDVWIGRGSLVMAGVHIGNGAVVGARSLVNSDIPPYAIAVGSPAKVIRHRFTPEQVELLQKIRWWDFPADTLAANIDLFNKKDIEAVISRLVRLRAETLA